MPQKEIIEKKEEVNKKTRGGRLIWAGAVLVLVKVFLTMGLPIYVIGDSAYDDNLFIRLAMNFSNGQWLGAFDKKTLLKRPMFAIYLAFIHKLNLSFRLSVILFYLASVLLLLLALRRVLKKKEAKFTVFAALLYSPIMIHSMYIQRVYRMAVMPAAITVVVATLLGLYFAIRAKEAAWYETLGWSLGAGFSFFFFWNMREDSIWLLPFFACALLVAFLYVLADMFSDKGKQGGWKAFFGRKHLFRIACLILPIVLALWGNHWVKWQNYRYYGVYTDSEMNDSEFGKLMSTMYAVESEDEYEFVNLTHATLDKIVAQSPSLQSMQKQIDGMYHSGWTMENGEIAGGYITYALRDALDKAGHYRNAVEKEAFCKQVREEIKAAMDDGRLPTKEGLYSVSYLLGKKGANPDVLIPKFFESLKWVVTYERMEAGVFTSSGKAKTIRNFEIMTNDLAIYPPEETFDVEGFGFSKTDGEKMRFVLEYEDGSVKEFASTVSSNDVFEHYINMGIIYDNARECRFKEALDFKYDKAMTLHIYLDDEEVETFDLWQLTPISEENDRYAFCFDKVGITSTPDALSEEGGMIALIDTVLLKVIRILAIPLLLLVLAAYVRLTWCGFLSRRDKKEKAFLRELWLIITGVFLSFILVTGGVTYRYAEAVNSNGRDFYLCSAYLMYQIFAALVIWVNYEYLPIALRRKTKEADGKEGKETE